MQLRYLSIIALFSGMIFTLQAQSENYLIAKAPFSTQKYSEFSPVYYKKSIVFCSNRDPAKISGYSTMDKKGFFKIYSADTTGANKEVSLFAGAVNSHFNNGPVSFSPKGDTIYFSRNLVVDGNYRDISGSNNKLGLFYAVLKNGEWTGVTELRFNDNSWNVTTPCLSKDGKRLYFASDKPAGYGGSDLYYSDWKNGYWNNAVNLGHLVNTGGNEAYPFVNDSGDLFFSSDSLPGKGGKDIFFTRYADSAWIKPVALSAPVNSPANDFGFISDNILRRGYFSSDRGGDLDIYSFRTVFPEFLYCPVQQSPKTCYSFSDDTTLSIDPGQLQLRWNFGEGKNIDGINVQHCYDKPGIYTVREDVIDRKTGRKMFNKMLLQVEVKSSDLPFIVADDFSSSGEPVSLTAGLESTRYVITSAYWDLGKEGRARGINITQIFRGEGETAVKLLANIREQSSGKLRQVCVTKILRTGTDAAYRQKENDSGGVIRVMPGNTKRQDNIKLLYSAKEQTGNKAVFRVQVLSSKKKLLTGDKFFSTLSPDFLVRTSPDEKGNYNYFIEEQQSLMETLYTFRKAIALGYKEAVVTTHIPSEGAERELWIFKRNHGTFSDNYFMGNGYSLAPKVVPVLDDLVLILKRNPDIRLVIEAHTDNSKDPSSALLLTQRQAKGIADYLTDHGIPASRLVAEGYGSSRPLAADFPETENRRNRRIDFIPLFHEE